MKVPKLFKKAAALVMAAVTTFSVLPATTAFAAGDIGTISFDFTYDRNGNAMRYNSSAVFDGYTAGGTGSYKYRMYVDGDNAFCIQPGVPLKTGNTLKKNSSQTWNALSSSQKKAVGLALLYGYQGNRSHLSGSDDEKWLATQTLARHMGVSKPSVCVAVNTLKDGGFLIMDEDHLLHLTDVGREVAEKIYERHCFFTKQLIAAGVDPRTAEADACRMEHVISNESFERLKKAAFRNQESEISALSKAIKDKPTE